MSLPLYGVKHTTGHIIDSVRPFPSFFNLYTPLALCLLLFINPLLFEIRLAASFSTYGKACKIYKQDGCGIIYKNRYGDSVT